MATKNRIDELQQYQLANEESSNNEKNSKKKKGKQTVLEIEEGNAFQNFEVIRQWVEALKENTRKCETTYRNNPTSKGLHKKLHETFKNSETLVYNIASTLKKINATLNNTENKSSAEFRMKLVQYTGVVNSFKQAVAEQETWAQKIFDLEKNFVQKCYQIVNDQNIDDSELSQLIDENPHLFTQDYIQNELEARRQLADLEARHQGLIAIEQHLVEIKELFISIATSVELQQESLDRIEYHAAHATDYVDKAVVELDKAKKSKKRGLKLKIAMGVVLLVIVIIILASIFS